MLTITLIYRLSPDRPPSFTVLATTVFIILAWDPNYIYDIGFRLSCVATRGIVTITPLLTGLVRLRWAKPPEWLCHGLAIPVTALLPVMPVTYGYFRTLPPYANPANLLASPLAAVATPSRFCGSSSR